jgi:hypothetical protein
LHGVVHAPVGMVFYPGQCGEEVLISQCHSGAPSAAVVGLGKGVNLDSYIPGPGKFNETTGTLVVEINFGIGIV